MWTDGPCCSAGASNSGIFGPAAASGAGSTASRSNLLHHSGRQHCMVRWSSCTAGAAAAAAVAGSIQDSLQLPVGSSWEHCSVAKGRHNLEAGEGTAARFLSVSVASLIFSLERRWLVQLLITHNELRAKSFAAAT